MYACYIVTFLNDYNKDYNFWQSSQFDCSFPRLLGHSVGNNMNGLMSICFSSDMYSWGGKSNACLHDKPVVMT